MKSAANQRIQRITSKGQITLPIAWRRKMNTDMIMVREMGNSIQVSAALTLPIDSENRDDDIIIFDANRDNGGKGIEAGAFAEILRRLNNKKK